MAQPPKRKMAPYVTPERLRDPDLVDRIFDYVLELLPELGGKSGEVKAAIRQEFGGVETYVRSGIAEQRTESAALLAHQVLSMFNGRNATEVARRLDISRATVYRVIKQQGRAS